PCAMMSWASHSAHPDRYAGVEAVAALRAADRLDVLSAKSFEYFLIARTSPLILASHLSLMEFFAQTVSFVDHIPSGREARAAKGARAATSRTAGQESRFLGPHGNRDAPPS